MLQLAMWQRQLERWKWMSSLVGCDMLQLAMRQKQPAMVQVVATQRRCCIVYQQDDAARAAITINAHSLSVVNQDSGDCNAHALNDVSQDKDLESASIFAAKCEKMSSTTM